jgi:Uncharacterized conserved protein, contains double-stranded beta-helix domain
MEFISAKEIKVMKNPGVSSRQILNPDNSESARVTITEVHVDVGAVQPRHTHDISEQIWYAQEGKATLLLADNEEKSFETGDVVRFSDGDIHGLRNDSKDKFVYISVTAPPIHFGYAYQK